MTRGKLVSCVLRSVLQLCTIPSDGTPKLDSKVLPEQSNGFRADFRLWRARKGEFASYVVFPGPSEKVIFNVWSYVDRETERRCIRVFPVSYYKDKKLVTRVPRVEKGKQPFLSGGILFNRFDVARIPQKYRSDLEQWALLIMEGVQQYDQKVREERLSRH